MKRKQITGLLLAVLLTLSMPLPVYADDGDITNAGGYGDGEVIAAVAGTVGNAMDVILTGIDLDGTGVFAYGDIDFKIASNLAGIEFTGLSADLDTPSYTLTYDVSPTAVPTCGPAAGTVTVTQGDSVDIDVVYSIVKQDRIVGSQAFPIQSHTLTSGQNDIPITLTDAKFSQGDDGNYGYTVSPALITLTGDTSHINSVAVQVTGANTITLTVNASAAKSGTANFTVIIDSLSIGGGQVTIPIRATLRPAVIPSGMRIKRANTDVTFGDLSATYGDPDNLTGGSVVTIPILAGYFIWEDSHKTEYDPLGEGLDWAFTVPSASQLSRATLRQTNKRNAHVFESVLINTSAGQAELTIPTFFSHIKPVDGYLSLALSAGGKATEPCQIDFYVSNQEEFIDEGQDEVYTEDNLVFTTLASVRGIRLIGDNGVSAIRNLARNVTVYFRTDNTIPVEDEELFFTYEGMDSVITLISVNVAGSGTTVEFDPHYYGNLHVYDAEKKYLGTTRTPLPYSDKYYLTTKRIDFPGAASPPPAPSYEAPAPEPEVPDTGGAPIEFLMPSVPPLPGSGSQPGQLLEAIPMPSGNGSGPTSPGPFSPSTGRPHHNYNPNTGA